MSDSRDSSNRKLSKHMSSSSAQDPYERDTSSTPMYNQNYESYGSYQPSYEPKYSIDRFSNSHRDGHTSEFLYTQSQLGRVEGSRNRRDRANDTLQVISNPRTDDPDDRGHRGSLAVEDLLTHPPRYPTDLEMEEGITDPYGSSMTRYNFEPVNQPETNMVDYFGTNGTPRQEDLDRDEKKRRGEKRHRKKRHRKESRRNEEQTPRDGDLHRERYQSPSDSRAPQYMGHNSYDGIQGQQIYSSRSKR